MSKNIKTVILLTLFFIIKNNGFSEVFFSGFAGTRLSLTSNPQVLEFDPQIYLQSFFSGQFQLSKNIISHTEFSIKTSDLIENSIFKKNPSEFQIDEISIIFRQPLVNAVNYLSLFMGTYEPIGADIFLRRQFGIQPIASRITEGWLGLAGSIIYPMSGTGISNIIHFIENPIATGFYIYLNKEIAGTSVFNADIRFAAVYRFLTIDFASGIGLPFNTDDFDDIYIISNKMYWRTGMNFLLGNNYTASLFIQAGISNIPFSKKADKFIIDQKKLYVLFEPRFIARDFKINISAFSMPAETINDFILIKDTLGINIDIFTDHLYLKNKAFIFGIHHALTFPEKNLLNLIQDPISILEKYNANIAPYVSTNFYSGELRTMLIVKFSDLIEGKTFSAFNLNIGYKTQF